MRPSWSGKSGRLHDALCLLFGYMDLARCLFFQHNGKMLRVVGAAKRAAQAQAKCKQSNRQAFEDMYATICHVRYPRNQRGALPKPLIYVSFRGLKGPMLHAQLIVQDAHAVCFSIAGRQRKGKNNKNPKGPQQQLKRSFSPQPP